MESEERETRDEPVRGWSESCGPLVTQVTVELRQG